MFYPEYIDMETEVLDSMMDMEMKKFLDEEPNHITAAICTICKEVLNFYFDAHCEIEYAPNEKIPIKQMTLKKPTKTGLSPM